MEELFIIRNTKDLYYHSFLPRGRVLWCDSEADAQYLTRLEAGNIMNMICLSDTGYTHITLSVEKV